MNVRAPRYFVVLPVLACLTVAGFSVHAQVADPKIAVSLDTLHAAMRAEDYAKARGLADAILARGTPAQRERATLAYGRILLGTGDQAAARLWLAKARAIKFEHPGAEVWLKVYQHWLDALGGKSKESVLALEGILKARQEGESTAEAADVLAALHLAGKDPEAAAHAARFGLQALQYYDLKTAYIEELLKRRLQAARPAAPVDPAEAIFRQAERLEQGKKYGEAGKLFQRVTKEFAESPWRHPAGYRTGVCLLKSDQAAAALLYWRQEFVKPAPAAPYRGQALLDIADYELEEQLDLKRAREALGEAEANLAAGIADLSWQTIRYPLFLRLGLVAYIQNDLAEAEAWFKKAQPLAPKEAILASDNPVKDLPPTRVARLIAACQSGEILTPAPARQGDPKVSLLLVIADLYGHAEERQKATGFYDRVLAPQRWMLKPSDGQTAHALYRRIQCYWEAEDAAAVVKYSEAFVTRFPKHEMSPDILLHCGLAHTNMLTDEAAAIHCFDRVIEHYSKTESARVALWHLATLHRWKKRYPEAIALYEQYKRRYPEDNGIPFVETVLKEMRGK